MTKTAGITGPAAPSKDLTPFARAAFNVFAPVQTDRLVTAVDEWGTRTDTWRDHYSTPSEAHASLVAQLTTKGISFSATSDGEVYTVTYRDGGQDLTVRYSPVPGTEQ